MPKYKLDEKGILTIVSETNGGISSAGKVFKVFSTILLIIAIFSSVAVYLFFYAEKPDSNYAVNYCAKNISEKVIVIDDSGEINVNLYCYKKLQSKVKKQTNDCKDRIGILIDNGESLLTETKNKIEAKKDKWS